MFEKFQKVQGYLNNFPIIRKYFLKLELDKVLYPKFFLKFESVEN